MAGVPAVKGEAYTFYTALTSQADTKLLKANPTLAAGDVKVSKDGGAVANPDTLPDAEPDAGYAIRVQLTATEMDADNVVVYFHDAAGDEWCDQAIVIQTAAAQIGDDVTLAADAITAAKIADDAFSSEHFATGALTADALADNAIDAGAIASNAITDAKIATGAITAAKFAAGAIDAAALSDDAVDAILDEVVEGTLTMRHILRILTSFVGAKVSGGGTTTVTFRDVGDTKARITMTVATASGDRSAVTLDGA